MKKLLLMFAIVAFAGVFATAQDAPAKTCTKGKKACAKKCTKGKKSCAKKCTKGKKACSKTANAAKVSNVELPSCPVKAAAKLASLDSSIEAKTCAQSGKTAYYRKSVCPTSGKVSMQEVHYCSKSQAFVNSAPSAAKAVQTGTAAPAKACTKGKKACSKGKKTCTKGAKAVQTSASSTKKACTKGKKACCKGKKAAKKTATSL